MTCCVYNQFIDMFLGTEQTNEGQYCDKVSEIDFISYIKLGQDWPLFLGEK